MRKFKKITAIFFVLLLVFSLEACSMETEQGNEIKAQCETFLDAMIAGDADAAYNVLASGTDRATFDRSFASLCEYIDGVEEYELKQIGWKTGFDNGLNYYMATFEMSTDIGNFQIIGMEADGYDGLANFRIISETELNPTFTGTITSLQGANIFQWAILAFSALSLAFSVWMLVDCCKRKLKYKALWLLLLIFGMMTFTLTFSEGNLDFRWFIGVIVFSYSYLQIYSTGAFVLKLVLPVGAVLYFVLRKIGAIEEKKAPAVSDEAPSESEESTETEKGNEK